MFLNKLGYNRFERAEIAVQLNQSKNFKLSGAVLWHIIGHFLAHEF